MKPGVTLKLLSPRPASRFAAGAAFGLCWTSPLRAGAESCLDVIHIVAPSNLAPKLRAELARGELDKEPGLECADARVTLASERPGFRVELVRSSGRIERTAASVELAAVWVDSWLRSGFSPEPANESLPPAPAPAPVPRAPVPHDDSPSPQAAGTAESGPRGSAYPLGFAALGEGKTFWIGPELGARIALSRVVWVGPELGVSFSTSTSGSRRVLRGGAAGGARFPLADALALYPGLSLGVATGSATTRTLDGTVVDDAGGLYAGATCDLALRIAGPVSLFAGLGGSAFLGTSPRPTTTTTTTTTDEEEQAGENAGEGEGAPLPEPLPAFLGGARLGISVSLGGAP